MPVYSIIIPAYNESERITATLESVAAYARQQQWDVEVLVVNDGSRDNTVAVVEQLAKRVTADCISVFVRESARLRTCRSKGGSSA